MKVAALDLGTNTFILLIAQVEDGAIQLVERDLVRIVRLGQGVHESRRLHPEALNRAEGVFAEFAAVIRECRVDRVSACATSAARDVGNADELIDRGRRHGIPIEVISGEVEAERTFRGTVLDDAPIAIIDIGGGSTEFILGEKRKIQRRQSLDIGSVRLTERYISRHPISAIELGEMERHLVEQLQRLPREFSSGACRKPIAVAGTATTLATLDQGRPFESEKVDGYFLPIERIRFWAEKLAAMSVEERRALSGMEAKRADVIATGAKILHDSCRHLRASGCEISVRGLRYGLALEMAED